MVIKQIVAQETLSLMQAETLRFAQGDSTTSVILSEAKNPALSHCFPQASAVARLKPGLRVRSERETVERRG